MEMVRFQSLPWRWARLAISLIHFVKLMPVPLSPSHKLLIMPMVYCFKLVRFIPNLSHHSTGTVRFTGGLGCLFTGRCRPFADPSQPVYYLGHVLANPAHLLPGCGHVCGDTGYLSPDRCHLKGDPTHKTTSKRPFFSGCRLVGLFAALGIEPLAQILGNGFGARHIHFGRLLHTIIKCQCGNVGLAATEHGGVV